MVLTQKTNVGIQASIGAFAVAGGEGNPDRGVT
jgi:hypothetical protein